MNRSSRTLCSVLCLSLGAALLAGCQRADYAVQARTNPAGGLVARLDQPGLWGIDLPELTPEQWGTLILENLSEHPLRAIQFWDFEAASLFLPPIADGRIYDWTEMTGPDPLPFDLLPDEQLICSPTPRAPEPGVLGTFFWDWPSPAPDGKWVHRLGCFNRLRQAEIDEARGLIMRPQGVSALAEVCFSAPFPLQSAAVSWEVDPAAKATVELWLSHDLRTWVQVQDRRARPVFAEPLRLDREIRGRRNFALRLVVHRDKAADPAEIVIQRWRVERSFTAPVRLGPDRDDLRLRFAGASTAEQAAPPRPALELRLLPPLQTQANEAQAD